MEPTLGILQMSACSSKFYSAAAAAAIQEAVTAAKTVDVVVLALGLGS